MELFLAKVYPETIMIVGRWSINVFLRYIRIQVIDISKGNSTFMTNKKSFCTIPEADIVYHTLGQDYIEPHSMNLHRRGR